MPKPIIFDLWLEVGKDILDENTYQVKETIWTWKPRFSFDLKQIVKIVFREGTRYGGIQVGSGECDYLESETGRYAKAYCNVSEEEMNVVLQKIYDEWKAWSRGDKIEPFEVTSGKLRVRYEG